MPLTRSVPSEPAGGHLFTILAVIVTHRLLELIVCLAYRVEDILVIEVELKRLEASDQVQWQIALLNEEDLRELDSRLST